jgi:thymidylate synthase (FAD)
MEIEFRTEPKVRLIAKTAAIPHALGNFNDSNNLEEVALYAARVSSNDQTAGLSKPGLLAYCIKHGHWSVFEQVSLTYEIETSRAVAAQILRHRSFAFQEFSQRYQVVKPVVYLFGAAAPHAKNRQLSTPMEDPSKVEAWETLQKSVATAAFAVYENALDLGLSKEKARAVLPLSVGTRLYMTGSLRSWIHYIQLRTAEGTQAEHRAVAKKIQLDLALRAPHTANALGWAPRG